MSTIRPVEFPSLEQLEIQQNASVTGRGKTERPVPGEATQQAQEVAPSPGRSKKEAVTAHQEKAEPRSEADKPAATTVRFYRPDKVKTQGVSVLGQHIDIRI